ncbi:MULTISPECIES: protein kinase domain-containing protein [Streptomyces]|uniref:protein kinase domain-containing protein n=1 Tax=Streptomyces TaxID=1883 RepID=UPI00081D6922|nr:protein kinase [Streptomyces sp. PpalLS-921]SCD35607.1 Protein kinase domain-containing protein [Streptomyces sp. PpalLS-921]
MSDAPPPLPTAVLDTLRPIAHRLVVHRRGSTVWDVTSPHGRHALKLGHPIEATPDWPAQSWTALAPAREHAVLTQLGIDGTVSGTWEHGTWNVQPWRDGTDLHTHWTPHRQHGATTEPDTDTALACVTALADLHAHGWVHGDVQPAHLVITSGRAHLIDLALARGGPVPTEHDFPYRGCLVHYEAPEIAHSILTTGRAEPTREADVYALGAALLISATGWRAVEYPDDAPRPVQRAAVANGHRRPVHAPGKLGDLIHTMLSHQPADRPTLRQVHDALK